MSRIVELQRPQGQGFGFSFIGGSNARFPPTISSLVKDSVSYNNEKIRVGDVIEKVNGVDVKALPTKDIVDLIQSSQNGVILTLSVADPESRELAKPFLKPAKSTESASSLTQKLKSASITLNTKHNSPVYQRTVGSPDYDRLGTDGIFCSTGSLDKLPVDLSAEGGDSDEVKRSPLAVRVLREKDKEDDLSDRVDFNIVKQTESEVNKEPNQTEERRIRLGCRPIFGSAPRLNSHFDPNDDIMRQISGQPFPHAQRSAGNRHAGDNNRGYAQQDNQTWGYNQSQANGQSVDRGDRYATDPRLSHNNQRTTVRPANDTWNRNAAAMPHRQQQHHGVRNGGLGLMSTRGAYSEERLDSISNAQDLRHTYSKHQAALEGGHTQHAGHRLHNSHDELESTLRGGARAGQHVRLPLQQGNGVVQFYQPNNTMDMQQRQFEHDQHRNVNNTRSLDTFIDTSYEADLQSSGYGAPATGFHRTNSLGRADIRNRYSGNKDFFYTDKTHPSRIDNDIRPMLSQSTQERLKEMKPISRAARNTGSGNAGVSYNTWQQTDAFNSSQANYSNNSSVITGDSGEYALNNGVVLRDSEDGTVHSRYDHGISLAVSAPDDYFASNSPSLNNSGLGKRQSDSFITGISPRSAASVDAKYRSDVGMVVARPNKTPIPGELKSFDPIDLATKLFTLNEFTRDDVAPFLGKNTEFSKQVCREYMKFMNFEGYPLDEALRILLKKFPLTGETQERERILLQFSMRYFVCNKPVYGSEDAVHTLTCALMLLNTDLHAQNIGNKMTLNEFINNLSGMCDGQDFSRDMLKTLYQSIKNREIQYADTAIPKEAKPTQRTRKALSSNGGNPFIELKAHDDAVVMREGMMYRKCIMETDGKRLPAMKRGWKMFYCTLKGLVLFLNKPDKSSNDQCIGIHHALAGFATEYKKRPFVCKLITSDWKVFMFQARSKTDVQDWVDAINLSAAAMSSPPLPAPCSSSKTFSRPVMPVSVTKLNLEEQIRRHQNRTEQIDKDMQEHREIQPHENSKEFKDWENKMHYLEFEYKRFSAYAKVLCTPRLKDSLDFLLSSRLKNSNTSDVTSLQTDGNSSLMQPHRSNSLNDIGGSVSPAHRRRVRQSYIRAVYS